MQTRLWNDKRKIESARVVAGMLLLASLTACAGAVPASAPSNLAGPAPNGYNQLLMPGQSFLITVTFQLITDIVSTINTASVLTGGRDVYDNPINTPSDDAEVINVPTEVTLRAFYVAAVNEMQITLAWETETEVDNYAFRLYRAPDQRQVLNADAQGSALSHVLIDVAAPGLVAITRAALLEAGFPRW